MLGRLGASRGTRSFYEELRARDDGEVEDEAGLNVDEENLRQQFNELDAEGIPGVDSRITVDSVYGGPRGDGGSHGRGRREPSSSKWPLYDDEADNDVPASLLVEHNEGERPQPAQTPEQPRHPRQPPLPHGAAASARSRAQWETATAQQRLHDDNQNGRPSVPPRPGALARGMISGGPREKALWRWVNTSNLDSFMRDVYDYYDGGGLWCILFSNALWLLSVLLLFFSNPNGRLTSRQRDAVRGSATHFSQPVCGLQQGTA